MEIIKCLDQQKPTVCVIAYIEHKLNSSTYIIATVEVTVQINVGIAIQTEQQCPNDWTHKAHIDISLGPLSGIPIPAARSASSWVCGAGPFISFRLHYHQIKFQMKLLQIIHIKKKNYVNCSFFFPSSLPQVLAVGLLSSTSTNVV